VVTHWLVIHPRRVEAECGGHAPGGAIGQLKK